MAGGGGADAVLSVGVDSQAAQRELGAFNGLLEKGIELVKELVPGFSALQGATSSVASAFQESGSALVAFGAALTAVIGLTSSAIEAAAKHERSLTNLSFALANISNAAGITTEHVEALSRSLSTGTVYGARQFEDATTILVRSGRVTQDSLEQSLRVSRELAAVLGSDVPEAARLLSRVLAEPGSGLQSLTRMGLRITAAEQQEVQYQAVAGGPEAGRRAALGIVQARTGEGLAQRQGEDFLGLVTQASNAFHGFLGALGEFPPIFDTAKLAVQVVTEVFRELATGMRALTGAFNSLVASVTEWTTVLARAFQPLTDAISSFTGWLRQQSAQLTPEQRQQLTQRMTPDPYGIMGLWRLGQQGGQAFGRWFGQATGIDEQIMGQREQAQQAEEVAAAHEHAAQALQQSNENVEDFAHRMGLLTQANQEGAEVITGLTPAVRENEAAFQRLYSLMNQGQITVEGFAASFRRLNVEAGQAMTAQEHLAAQTEAQREALLLPRSRPGQFGPREEFAAQQRVAAAVYGRAPGDYTLGEITRVQERGGPELLRQYNARLTEVTEEMRLEVADRQAGREMRRDENSIRQQQIAIDREIRTLTEKQADDMRQVTAMRGGATPQQLFGLGVTQQVEAFARRGHIPTGDPRLQQISGLITQQAGAQQALRGEEQVRSIQERTEQLNAETQAIFGNDQERRAASERMQLEIKIRQDLSAGTAETIETARRERAALEEYIKSQDIHDRLQEMADGFRKMGDAAVNAFEQIVIEGKSAQDVVRNLLLQFAQLLFQLAAHPLEQQFSSWIGGLMGIGGAATAGATAAAAGAAATAGTGAIGGGLTFATGGVMTSRGPVRMYQGGGVANSPQTAVFGEGSTPELYLPLPGGKVPVALQGGSMGGGRGTQINITNNITGTGSESQNTALARQASDQMILALRTEIMRTIADQQRPAGMLGPRL